MSIDVMASLKDIAETAGCSVSTVSRVLKNKGEIAPATRKKILAIADQFGYHDNRLIYGIRTGRTQTIGLVCDFGNPFFQRIAHGIELELKKEDYLVIFSSNEENDQKTLKRLVEQRVDGVILVPRNDFADTEYFRDVITAIKLRKSPFDLSTSHHAHQEMVKGITTEMSGPALAIMNIAEYYELVLLLGIFSLFFINSTWWSWIVAIIACGLVFFAETLWDNVSARVKWKSLLYSCWIVTLVAGGVNILILMLIK